MPAIDYNGQYHVYADSIATGNRAAISFPIKASRASTAKRFASKAVLSMLPGWTVGNLRLYREGMFEGRRTFIESWLLKREPKQKARRCR